MGRLTPLLATWLLGLLGSISHGQTLPNLGTETLDLSQFESRFAVFREKLIEGELSDSATAAYVNDFATLLPDTRPLPQSEVVDISKVLSFRKFNNADAFHLMNGYLRGDSPAQSLPSDRFAEIRKRLKTETVGEDEAAAMLNDLASTLPDARPLGLAETAPLRSFLADPTFDDRLAWKVFEGTATPFQADDKSAYRPAHWPGTGSGIAGGGFPAVVSGLGTPSSSGAGGLSQRSTETLTPQEMQQIKESIRLQQELLRELVKEVKSLKQEVASLKEGQANERQ